jgi:hypothetical protein
LGGAEALRLRERAREIRNMFLRLSSDLAVQRPGLTGAGQHSADGTARRAVKVKLCPSSSTNGECAIQLA